MNDQSVIRQTPADWQAGYDAAIAGKPQHPVPPGVDALSFYSGWIEGNAQDKRNREEWYAEQKAARGNPYL